MNGYHCKTNLNQAPVSSGGLSYFKRHLFLSVLKSSCNVDSSDLIRQILNLNNKAPLLFQNVTQRRLKRRSIYHWKDQHPDKIDLKLKGTQFCVSTSVFQLLLLFNSSVFFYLKYNSHFAQLQHISRLRRWF